MVLRDEKLQSNGTQSRLAQGYSRFYSGAVGTVGDVRFQVLGRVRYAFANGFWDEWYIKHEDGTGFWITEDNYSFAIQRLHNLPDPLMPLKHYKIGDDITVDGRDYQVSEIGKAECLGIEGEVPKEILATESYMYIDAISYDGTHTLGVSMTMETGPQQYS